MMLPTYYKCKECECEFPHKDYDHDAGMCKNCLIIKTEPVAEVPCSDRLVDPFEKACKLLAGITDCPYIHIGAEVRDECEGAMECCEIADKGEAYKCWAEYLKRKDN